MVKEEATPHQMRQKKGLFEYQEALHAPSKKRNAFHAPTHNYHVSTTLLNKKINISREKNQITSCI
jgi:hypothetical protein